jgi:hypothetical protein
MGERLQLRQDPMDPLRARCSAMCRDCLWSEPRTLSPMGVRTLAGTRRTSSNDARFGSSKLVRSLDTGFPFFYRSGLLPNMPPS